MGNASGSEPAGPRAKPPTEFNHPTRQRLADKPGARESRVGAGRTGEEELGPEQSLRIGMGPTLLACDYNNSLHWWDTNSFKMTDEVHHFRVTVSSVKGTGCHTVLKMT